MSDHKPEFKRHVAADAVDGYLATIARLEPDIAAIDHAAAAASVAISLKRIADALEKLMDNLVDIETIIAMGDLDA